MVWESNPHNSAEDAPGGFLIQGVPMKSHLDKLPQGFSDARIMWNGLLTLKPCLPPRVKTMQIRSPVKWTFRNHVALKLRALHVYMAPECHSQRHLCTVLTLAGRHAFRALIFLPKTLALS